VFGQDELQVMNMIGKTVGHIRIVGVLGRGGMGEVYRGFDDKLKRKVAVKAIGTKTRSYPQAKKRFLREARALSQLEHPNICQIYDYIEAKENDYLVLEFIEGKSLHQAIKQGIDKSHKIKIAEQIANVLAVAHEKGVVHRDLKPANIMITSEGEVKVLDFGLARFVKSMPESAEPKEEKRAEPLITDIDGGGEEDVTETIPPQDDEEFQPLSSGPSVLTHKTKEGAVIGTPMYMSPEQAQGEGVTTTSDMYSFGLLLQEMFTGQPAYEKTDDKQELLEKVIQSKTKTLSGDRSDLTKLINRLKSPAPAARPTAVEAVACLKRLREKPKRIIRRAVVAGFILIAVLVGLKYTFDLRRERELAIEARDEATDVVSFLVDLFEVSDPGEAQGKTITAREILGKGAKEVEQVLQGQPLTQAKLLDTIGTVYRKLGLYSEAEPLLRQALSIREEFLGSESIFVAESLLSLASLNERQGKYEEAKELIRHCLVIREKELASDHPDIAECLYTLARIHYLQFELDKALSLHQRALEIREKSLGLQHPDTAESLVALGAIYYSLGQFDESERCYQQALTIRENVLGPNHPDVGRSLSKLAGLNSYLRRFENAETLYRQALENLENTLGPVHPEVANCLNNIATFYYYQRKYAEAEDFYKQALEIRIKSLGENHPDVAENIENLGILYHVLERYDEAEEHYQQSLALKEKAFGSDHPRLVRCLHNLGLLYQEQGRQDRPEAFFKRALGIVEKSFGPEHVRVIRSLKHLGSFYLGDKDYNVAESHFLRALALSEKEYGPDHVNIAQILIPLGQIMIEKGQYQDAERNLRRALDICEKNSDADPVTEANARFHLAYLYHHHLNRQEEAEVLYSKTLSLQEENLEREDRNMQETIKEYASLLRELGKNKEARELEERLKTN
jgi:tetratricopeptide (TPR) repeat protein